MSANYSIQENPKMVDQFLIWDEGNSSWKRAPFSAVLTLFNDNTDVSDGSIHLLYSVTDSVDITYALPDATAVVSRYVIKRTGAGSGKIFFTTVSSQTIDGVVPTNFSLSGEEQIIFYALSGQWYTEYEYKLKLNPSRIADQEIPTAELAAGSWNIASLEAVAGGRATSTLRIVDSGGTTTVEAAITMSASAKTHSNSTIKIISKSGSPLVSTVKLGKADGVDAAGAYITIELSSASEIIPQILGNTGSGAGFALIVPNQETDLPDEVTTATFLEAGEEFEIALSVAHLPVTGFVVSDDQLACSMPWGQIPKQGIGITVTDPDTSWVIIYPDSSSGAFTGATVSNLEYFGNTNINFRLDKIGGFTGKSGLPIVIRTNGTGGKLTIT